MKRSALAFAGALAWALVVLGQAEATHLESRTAPYDRGRFCIEHTSPVALAEAKSLPTRPCGVSPGILEYGGDAYLLGRVAEMTAKNGELILGGHRAYPLNLTSGIRNAYPGSVYFAATAENFMDTRFSGGPYPGGVFTVTAHLEELYRAGRPGESSLSVCVVLFNLETEVARECADPVVSVTGQLTASASIPSGTARLSTEVQVGGVLAGMTPQAGAAHVRVTSLSFSF